MYNIIFWDHYCQIVPHNWVSLKDKTFICPASKCNMTNAIKKKIEPRKDWKLYKYRKILGPYDTYDTAREVEKSCIDISTSDENKLAALNKVQQLPLKRLITPKTFYDDSDDSDAHNASISKKRKLERPPSNYKTHDDQVKKRKYSIKSANPESDIKHKKETSCLPIKPFFNNIPPSLKHHPFSIEIFQDENNESEINNNAPDFNEGIDNDKEHEEFDINKNEKIYEENEICEENEEINGENEEINEENEEINEENEEINEENEDLNRGAEVNVEINNVDENIHTTLHALHETINILREDIEQFKTEMRREASRNKTKLQEILTILRERFPRNEQNEEITMDLMPDFPLTSVEEYIQFDERLKNDEAIRNCFYKKIKYIGGDTVQKMISNILTTCITFEVGHKLSWTGAKNTVAIEKSTFANTIVGAVINTKEKTPDCSVALIVKHIRNWLQHAGDKMRYRMKKMQGEERNNENQH